MRSDLNILTQWIAPKSRLMDLGCGDGTLLKHLQQEKNIQGIGIEIDPNLVVTALQNGIDVLQMNLESGLSGFEDRSFDTVILSQTLQAMKHTEPILREMLRVGRQGIVTFPNFGYWSNRWQVLQGIMPVSEAMPHEWYNTPNVHLCTLKDFERLIETINAQVVERITLNPSGQRITFLPNLFGSLALYRIQLR